MKCILTAILLWPCAAMADQTVETNDGQRILLRDNGTYTILKRDALACKETERYTELDYHYRSMWRDMRELADKKASVCVVADIKVFENDKDFAQFKYFEANHQNNAADGAIDITKLPRDRRVYMLDHCMDDWCRAVIYGQMSGSYKDRIDAQKIEFGK
jgi:hypothetical protein